MSFATLLFRTPPKPCSASLLRALADAQDRAFAGAPEGIVNHVNDWDSSRTNRSFFLVAGTHRYQDGRRATTHCTSFQKKEAALTFAERWRLNCPADEIRVLVGEVEWEPFEPTTKTDRAAVARILKKAEPEADS